MARQEHVITVFVASPGDVDAERGKLEDVIRELNTTWSRQLSIRLDLARWETHAYPGFGADAQDVINNQIPADYDLFVGIMWCRYGTPTGRTGSGTVEEFERAKARYDADKSSVQLMVYFKDEPIPPSHLDPDQLAKVNEFRKALGDEGGLYWKFTDINQFEKLIRLHLTRQVQALKLRSQSGATIEPDDSSLDETVPPKDDSDDDGILDLMEVFQDRFAELLEIMQRITAATEEIGGKMRERAAEINALPRDAKGHADPQEAKRLLTKVASDMDDFTERMDAELPLFSNATNTGMNAFIKVATLSVDLKNDQKDVHDCLSAVRELQRTIAASKESIAGYLESVASLPRMTTTLNKAKRGAVGALNRFLAELTNSEQLSAESEKVIRDLCDEADGI